MLWLFVSACTTSPPVPNSTLQIHLDWPARKAQLEKLQSWRLQGRVAVKDGNQGWQADVLWQQQQDEYSIDLIGPFGQGRVTVTGTADRVTLRSQQSRVTAADPDMLLAQITGVRLPVKGLRYWIRGIPVPSQPVQGRVFDQNQRLTRFQQQGWTIDVLSYTTLENGLELPRRMNAERGAVKVKLLVSTWQLPT